jgi:uncharacterized membrane protein YfcA
VMGQVLGQGLSLKRAWFTFHEKRYDYKLLPLGILSLLVGIVGGIYGIGGGVIIAPFCIAVLGLPVYTVAGATLFGTFLVSIAGALFYSVIPSMVNTSPDWALGALLGLGGIVGLYLGARVQRYVPQKPIKLMLGLTMLGLGLKYILEAL